MVPALVLDTTPLSVNVTLVPPASVTGDYPDALTEVVAPVEAFDWPEVNGTMLFVPSFTQKSKSGSLVTAAKFAQPEYRMSARQGQPCTGVCSVTVSTFVALPVTVTFELSVVCANASTPAVMPALRRSCGVR